MLLTQENIDTELENIEQRILNTSGITATTWMGVEISWKHLSQRKGGDVKRNKSYGKFYYHYLGEQLTRNQTIAEIMKPPSLRQALIEAGTSIECSMCGKIAVGKDALNPYQSSTFIGNKYYEKKPWGLIFYGFIDGDYNKPRYLNFCPKCLESIARGDYRED